MRSIHSLLLPASLSLCVLAGGCEEEGFVTLFDEEGTWSLISYDLEGSGTYETIESTNRIDKFLMHFVRTSAEGAEPAGKVAAATCIDLGGDQSLTSSSCNDGFTCRCFNYSYNEATMTFTEYEAANATLYAPMEGEPAPGEPVAVFLSTVDNNDFQFIFKPLPSRLFQSDAMISGYQMRNKADSLFEQTDCFERCAL